ncbi:MAG: ELM1/GtrOC1 family putative glycosyltransferase, partial [Pseudomonadota bacterium]
MSGAWVLTDGRPGNEGPATALAAALEARGWPRAKVVRAAPTAKTALLPAAAWTTWGAKRGGWPFSGYEDPSVFDAEWPELVISAGRRSAPAAAAMKSIRRRALKAVQILDPGLSPRRFDVMVTPEHDGLVGAGIVTTLGALSRVGPLGPPPEGPPSIAALIGGPSGSARWSEGDGRALIGGLSAVLSDGVAVEATGSRRTPEGLLDALRAAGTSVWDGEGANPYPEMLRGASAVVVTADSVNLASEAASAGRPVLVAPVSGLAPKLRR